VANVVEKHCEKLLPRCFWVPLGERHCRYRQYVRVLDISQLSGLAVTSGGAVLPLIDMVGAQLYSGDVTMPTCLLGTFDQTSFADGSDITVAISQVTLEPSSLVLFGSGALGLVAALRRRRLIE
jgi:hypothetical protein